ncbi:MAG: hypothetical protein LBQ46_05255 [Treponema sp.]|jgi:hypothetical protein|nr:hypothetical protein [Treponema sp.]
MRKISMHCGPLLGVLLGGLLAASCAGGGGGGDSDVLDTKTFWAQSAIDDTYYQLTADLLAIGNHCTVWVERESRGRVSAQGARNVAAAYDSGVYPAMMDNFVISGQISDGSTVNTMEYADVDGDGKLCILLLDIKDGWTPGSGYVDGYFWPGNLFGSTSYPNSNQKDMIYVDAYPGTPGSDSSNSTLAHELQHLLNFTASYLSSTRNGTLMDLWIDEGLSSAAEYVYQGSHVTNRVNWYNTDLYGTIAKGNNFFRWENNGKTGSPNSVLDEYATVYLFFQWLRIQSGGTNGIYKNIISSQKADYRAVTEAVYDSLTSSVMTDGEDWDSLLKTWLAANYINAPSGPYGYGNDPVLKDVHAKTAPATPTTLSLYPGEGVYSVISPSYTASPSGSIKYAGLNKASPSITSYNNGDWLLTYNANTNKGAESENGSLTGNAANVVPSAARTVGDLDYRIDFRGPDLVFPVPFVLGGEE